MAERIYLTTTDGNIEPLQEKAFDLEDELQALIAEHPELLDGEQIRPGGPRRWLLISREKGIAEAAGEGARWTLDHLLPAYSGPHQQDDACHEQAHNEQATTDLYAYTFGTVHRRQVAPGHESQGADDRKLPDWPWPATGSAHDCGPGVHPRRCARHCGGRQVPRDSRWMSWHRSHNRRLGLTHLYHREPRLGEDSPRFDRFSHVTY